MSQSPLAPQRLWLNPDVRRFFAGQVWAEVGARITREGLPIVAILVASATAPQLGVLAAATTLPALLVGNLLGHWADLVRRRPLMMWGALGRGLVLALVPALYFLGRLDFCAILVIAVLAAAFAVLLGIARHAYLPSLVTPARIEEGNQLLGTADSMGETLGPGVMGLLIHWLGSPLAILFDAVSNWGLVWALAGMKDSEVHPLRNHPTDGRRDGGDTTRQVWLFVVRHPSLGPLWLNAGVAALFGGFYSALYELYVIKTLHLGPFWLGLLITMGGLGSLVGTRLFSRWRRTRSLPVLTAWGYLGYAVLAVCVPLASGPFAIAFALLFLAQFGGDLGATVSQIGAYTIEQQVTPNHRLGRVRGTFYALTGGMEVVGALVGGPLAVWLSIRGALWVAFAGLVAASPLLWIRPFIGLHRKA